MSLERRKELAKLVFGFYARTLPNGRLVPRELPEPLIAQMASSPLILDLDRHIREIEGVNAPAT